jgi:acetyl esterase/lipase
VPSCESPVKAAAGAARGIERVYSCVTGIERGEPPASRIGCYNRARPPTWVWFERQPSILCPGARIMHRRRFRAFAVTTVVLFVAAPSNPALAAPPYEVELKQDVEYGTGGAEKLLLDQAIPKGLEKPGPGLVFIHGGGWAGGSKQDFQEGAKNYAAMGYPSITINYRLAPTHKFPAQIEDCKCAVRWMRAHATELNIDPNRIGALGASAGGHLVMMLGSMDTADGLEGEGGWQDQSSKVQSVVAYFGPTNLASEYPPLVEKLLVDFLGGTAAEKPEVYKQASPVTYVNAGDAPMLLFQGTKDVLVPYEQAWQMAQKLTDAGVPGRVELLLGENHGWGGANLVHTIQETTQFFDETLKKEQ